MAALAAHQASYEAVAKAAAKAREDAARKNATDEPRAPDAHTRDDGGGGLLL